MSDDPEALSPELADPHAALRASLWDRLIAIDDLLYDGVGRVRVDRATELQYRHEIGELTAALRRAEQSAKEGWSDGGGHTRGAGIGD